jgi:hypothetical protein
MTDSCGCKICKANLGDFTNQLILDGLSPRDTLKCLEAKGLKVSERVLKNHLSAFDIEYSDSKGSEVVALEPISLDLNTIDFSEYAVDFDNSEEVITYLQKLNLKLYLNQLKIALNAQQRVINGEIPELPDSVMKNLAIAFQILDKSSGLSIQVNQQQAIREVEKLGLAIVNPYNSLKSLNAEN